MVEPSKLGSSPEGIYPLWSAREFPSLRLQAGTTKERQKRPGRVRGDRKQWLPLSLQGGWLQESVWEGHSFFLAGMNRRTEFRLENGPMSQARVS